MYLLVTVTTACLEGNTPWCRIVCSTAQTIHSYTELVACFGLICCYWGGLTIGHFATRIQARLVYQFFRSALVRPPRLARYLHCTEFQSVSLSCIRGFFYRLLFLPHWRHPIPTLACWNVQASRQNVALSLVCITAIACDIHLNPRLCRMLSFIVGLRIAQGSFLDPGFVVSFAFLRPSFPRSPRSTPRRTWRSRLDPSALSPRADVIRMSTPPPPVQFGGETAELTYYSTTRGSLRY